MVRIRTAMSLGYLSCDSGLQINRDVRQKNIGGGSVANLDAKGWVDMFGIDDLDATRLVMAANEVRAVDAMVVNQYTQLQNMRDNATYLQGNRYVWLHVCKLSKFIATTATLGIVCLLVSTVVSWWAFLRGWDENMFTPVHGTALLCLAFYLGDAM